MLEKQFQSNALVFSIYGYPERVALYCHGALINVCAFNHFNRQKIVVRSFRTKLKLL
jgi:hypothetical protein